MFWANCFTLRMEISWVKFRNFQPTKETSFKLSINHLKDLETIRNNFIKIDCWQFIFKVP